MELAFACPWVAAPLLADETLAEFIRHFTPIGVVTSLVLDGVRRPWAPALVSVPAAAIVLCLLAGRWRRRSKSDTSSGESQWPL